MTKWNLRAYIHSECLEHLAQSLMSCSDNIAIDNFDNALPTTTESVWGPIVQSIVSLTSSLMVKMLTVLVSKISALQVFLLKKCE